MFPLTGLKLEGVGFENMVSHALKHPSGLLTGRDEFLMGKIHINNPETLQKCWHNFPVQNMGPLEEHNNKGSLSPDSSD